MESFPSAFDCQVGRTVKTRINPIIGRPVRELERIFGNFRDFLASARLSVIACNGMFSGGHYVRTARIEQLSVASEERISKIDEAAVERKEEKKGQCCPPVPA